MTNDELKKALFNKRRVVYNNPANYGTFEFDKVNAIIYRTDKWGNVYVSAELLDKAANSIIIARAAHIEYAPSRIV